MNFLLIVLGVWLLGIYPAMYVLARWAYNADVYPQGEHPKPGDFSNRGMCIFYGCIWPATTLTVVVWCLGWVVSKLRWLGLPRLTNRVLDRAYSKARKD